MTTTTALPARTSPPTVILSPRVHYAIVAGKRMFCIQPNCDGEHHWYCGCDH